MQCLLGLHADLPSGTVQLTPIGDHRFGALRVTGLKAGDEEYGVEVGPTGSVWMLDAPAWVGASEAARSAGNPDEGC